MACKDCIHYEVCVIVEHLTENDEDYYTEFGCNDFINKPDVIEFETIKAWLYSIVINNIGASIDGDFSAAYEEIIKRLDGLIRFAKERRDKE